MMIDKELIETMLEHAYDDRLRLEQIDQSAFSPKTIERARGKREGKIEILERLLDLFE